MKRVLSIFLAAALVLLTLAGCGAAPKAKEKVRLCEVTHSVFYAPQYAAIHLGFFDDAGIEIELSNGQGADKVMASRTTWRSALPGRRLPSMSTTRGRKTTPRSLPS